MGSDRQQEESCPNSRNMADDHHKSLGRILAMKEISGEKKKTGNKYIEMLIMVAPAD